MAEDAPDAAPAAPSEPAHPTFVDTVVHDAEALEARLWSAIQRWRDVHLAGGPIARATECWNHLQSALAHLAAAIVKEL